jgi:hypothetical protein
MKDATRSRRSASSPITSSERSTRRRVDDPQHVLRRLDRRVRAADGVAQRAAVARETGAQLAEDDLQALADRQLERRQHDVGVDRRVRVLERHRRRRAVAGAQLLAPRRAGRALHEALADERLRRDEAVGVRAERREAPVDLHLDPRVVVGRDADVLDRAGVDARDPHVLAGDDEGGVVEQRVDAVRVAAGLRRGAPARDRDHDGGDQGAGGGGEALHFGGVWLRSQWPWTSSGCHGMLASAGATDPPGQ